MTVMTTLSIIATRFGRTCREKMHSPRVEDGIVKGETEKVKDDKKETVLEK
jgi:hypothetical protein